MIGYLRGTVLEVSLESFVLLVGAEGSGVGYELLSHSRLLAELEMGDSVQVWVHTHMREDALQLFGFESADEKAFFHSLLKVNGVGPKLALNALSGGTPSDISRWIENEDIKALSKLPKVGKKTAEQMVLTLKGKLVEQKHVITKPAGVLAEISSALLNLGFKPVQVDKVVEKLPPTIEFEDGIKLSLTRISGG
jgi:Holliday junction DNA helicase RuvA